MCEEQTRVLVVGPEAAFHPLLEQLAVSGCTFQHAPYSGPPLVSTGADPTVVLLLVPEDRHDKQQALACLRALRGQAPVVVLSLIADMEVYVACMTCGAFDYITAYTPLAEVTRILHNATHAGQLAAA